MHYCLTRCTDTEFWRVKPPSPSGFENQSCPVQADTPLPSGGLPGDHRSPIDTAGLWNHESDEAIPYGTNFLRNTCDEWFGKDRPKARVPGYVLEKLKLAPRNLPPHDLWLKRILGMPDYPTARRSLD